MADIQTLANRLKEQFANFNLEIKLTYGEITVDVVREHLLSLCRALRDGEEFKFELCMDVCGVDYSEYGVTEWATEEPTETGFSRGVEEKSPERVIPWDKPRFAVVYHLLSVTHNHRLRLRTFADDKEPRVDSVITIWNSADWFEREAFDLYGILFDGHPDLRRILTDYGFSGYPFRKDFPLVGNVEPRYDAAAGRIIYEPVNIEPRTLVPKVIRKSDGSLASQQQLEIEGN